MYEELIKRLRNKTSIEWSINFEAADAIEQLQAELEIKVIINEGVVEAVLKNQDIPVRLEVIDINTDYSDYEALEDYRNEVYDDPAFKDCDYTVANFEEE